jgi:hypothetical protein
MNKDNKWINEEKEFEDSLDDSDYKKGIRHRPIKTYATPKELRRQSRFLLKIKKPFEKKFGKGSLAEYASIISSGLKPEQYAKKFNKPVNHTKSLSHVRLIPGEFDDKPMSNVIFRLVFARNQNEFRALLKHPQKEFLKILCDPCRMDLIGLYGVPYSRRYWTICFMRNEVKLSDDEIYLLFNKFYGGYRNKRGIRKAISKAYIRQIAVRQSRNFIRLSNDIYADITWRAMLLDLKFHDEFIKFAGKKGRKLAGLIEQTMFP